MLSASACCRLAEEDERVVAGAAVGSLAVDGGDRFSDLDLTFGIADHVPVADVLDDWTRTLIDELDAVQLADLERGPTTYRVFLLPDALQLDLSMTPAAQFRPAGPRFRLLFGETAAGESEVPPAGPGNLFISTPAVAGDIFGWGVIYALHARACIERGRVWQAEHYVGAVRDHALSLACLREGLPAVQARGYDDLSAETLARFEDAHVGAVEPGALRAALAASVRRARRTRGADAARRCRCWRAGQRSRMFSWKKSTEPRYKKAADARTWRNRFTAAGLIDIVYAFGYQFSTLTETYHFTLPFGGGSPLFARLILFDRRGTGLSDRSGLEDAGALEAGMDDILCGDGRRREGTGAVVRGWWTGGMVSGRVFAASHPDLDILGLVL